jgi:large subunit ribosomal protein L15
MSRAGSSVRAGFEGGQMPLIRRLPKRGFSNAMHRKVYLPVNLGALDQFEEGATVDLEVIQKAGLANGTADGIKILANGELTKKLNVTAHKFSAAARSAIEKLGGTCTALEAGKEASEEVAQPEEGSEA